METFYEDEHLVVHAGWIVLRKVRTLPHDLLMGLTGRAVAEVVSHPRIDGTVLSSRPITAVMTNGKCTTVCYEVGAHASEAEARTAMMARA